MTRYVWEFAGIRNGRQHRRLVASYMDDIIRKYAGKI